MSSRPLSLAVMTLLAGCAAAQIPAPTTPDGGRPATPPPVANPPSTTPPPSTPTTTPPETGTVAPQAADAGAPKPATDAAPAPAGGDGAGYACPLVIGINATSEWYDQGFEKLVPNEKWELIRVHSGFIELWADPNNGVWKTAISSPCAQNPNQPDRVLFVALNFDFTTLDQWLPPLTATVKNLRARYASAKRIELMTFVRAPGNK